MTPFDISLCLTSIFYSDSVLLREWPFSAILCWSIYKEYLLNTFQVITITIRYECLCHRYFLPVLPLNQQWSPPLTLQTSHCSTFRIVCDVPSVAVFCSESIECFPGIFSKFFLKLLVTIPVAPIITGTIVHFRFHIRCISIHKLLYFNLFSASFCTTFLSAAIATSISVHVFSFFIIIIIIIIIIIHRVTYSLSRKNRTA